MVGLLGFEPRVLLVKSQMFLPLNYRPMRFRHFRGFRFNTFILNFLKKLAGVIRFELMMTISKTVALGQTRRYPNKKLVWEWRIELPLQASKARRLPLSYTQIKNLVEATGLEPAT